MDIIGISINHRTSTIELREKLHLLKNDIVEIIPQMKQSLFSEGFILSTCNRTEVFGLPTNNNIDYAQIINFISEIKGIPALESKNFEKYFSCSAVKHIFRVCTGLDSLILGDSQILGQSKEAFQISEENGFANTSFKRLFDASLKAGKRAINESHIGEGAVTVSFAAVQVIEKIFADLSSKSALVIGAGETGELAAVHLNDKGVTDLTIANRTFSKAEKLATKLNARTMSFQSIKDNMNKFDIIVSATSSPDYILDKKDIKAAIKKRKGAPVCLMDIALPRDIDPESAKIDNVFYHDIDSLNIIVEENLQKRKSEIPIVDRIIMDEMVHFFSWHNTLDIVPTIKSFREFFEELRIDELKKIKHKLDDEEFKKVEDMTRRLIGRILHNPTLKLRNLAESGENIEDLTNYTLLLNDLFILNGKNKNENESNKKQVISG
ncbi:MAG: glutamyl-tRNA reductase [Melioribacteraceae bacterium]|nr:glutamyl-tRNA reductase [Melioribacteraceae bacterium]